MNIKEQMKRREQFNKLYLPIVLEEINKGINRPADDDGIEWRSWVWNCVTLFEEGYKEEANKVILEVTLGHCHFLPMQFLSIIRRYGDMLLPETRKKMDDYVFSELDFAAGDNIHISMYNDNFANMAIYTLLVAGELYDLPQYFRKGLEKLEGVADLFRRCGQLMEYSSPVYTSVDTLCFAEMVNHVKDEYAASLARKCEERMWLEISALFHKPSGRMAGPISRAYTTDTIGHPNTTTCILWMAFGDDVIINPIVDFFPPRQNQIIHISSNRLLLPNCAWIANIPYHIPECLLDLAVNKKFPFEAAFTTECIPSDALAYNDTDEIYDEFGGYRGLNYTYMTEEYALGTAQGQYHSGAMSESFYITYKNRKISSDLTHTGVVFSKYVFNDHTFLEDNIYEHYGFSHRSGFRDEGRKFGIQHKNTSMVLYKPLHLERKKVTKAMLNIYFPVHFTDEFEFYADGSKIDKTATFTSKEPVSVAVCVGSCYFGFIPLALTDFGRKAAVRIERTGNFYIVSLINYEGAERSFEIMELVNAQSGFVCICGTQDEYDRQAFCNYLNDCRITDTLETSAKMVTRRAKYQSNNLELYLVMNPLTESIIADTINKRPRGATVEIMRVDSIDLSKVPFSRENEEIEIAD